jgi:hypothetical protein
MWGALTIPIWPNAYQMDVRKTAQDTDNAILGRALAILGGRVLIVQKINYPISNVLRFKHMVTSALI